MSAVTPVEQDQEERQEPAASTPAAKVFRYSQYVDVGEGAEECEHKRDGACENPEHFHAWCRLPNPYQEEDIRGKAMAAKARRVRALRDPESDAAVVLDSELMKVKDPAYADTIIDELLQEEWADSYGTAIKDVEEREEFEHHEQDRQEFLRLHEIEGKLPAEEQSEEYRRLQVDVQAYLDAVRARTDELQSPKRAQFQSRSFESLFDLLRDRRIDSLADQAFIDAYNAWTLFAGTFKAEPAAHSVRSHEPMWSDIGSPMARQPGTMYAESNEVIGALTVAFNGLRTSLRTGSSGN